MQFNPSTPTATDPDGSTTDRVTSPALAARLLLQVSFIFAVVYVATNYLTSLRADIGRGVFDWERAIPFIEWTVVPYLSIFVLLPLSFFVCRDAPTLQLHTRRLLLALALAVVCYAAFPLGFHFTRPQPQGAFAPLFDLLWAVDLPYNRAPSLHIVVLNLMWPRLAAHVASGWQRLAVHGWLAAIGVSVLTTYQHHLIDIVGGVAVAATCFALTQRGDGRSAFPAAFGAIRTLGALGALSALGAINALGRQRAPGGTRQKRPNPAQARATTFSPSQFAC